jgi:hypothetical protein
VDLPRREYVKNGALTALTQLAEYAESLRRQLDEYESKVGVAASGDEGKQPAASEQQPASEPPEQPPTSAGAPAGAPGAPAGAPGAPGTPGGGKPKAKRIRKPRGRPPTAAAAPAGRTDNGAIIWWSSLQGCSKLVGNADAVSPCSTGQNVETGGHPEILSAAEPAEQKVEPADEPSRPTRESREQRLRQRRGRMPTDESDELIGGPRVDDLDFDVDDPLLAALVREHKKPRPDLITAAAARRARSPT